MKLASNKSALNPPLVCSTDHFKTVVPVLVLLFYALWFTLRGDLSLALCYFVLVFFSPFNIAITSLGGERANLGAYHMFVRFALAWFCLFPLCVWGSSLWLWHFLDFSLTFFTIWKSAFGVYADSQSPDQWATCWGCSNEFLIWLQIQGSQVWIPALPHNFHGYW